MGRQHAKLIAEKRKEKKKLRRNRPTQPQGVKKASKKQTNAILKPKESPSSLRQRLGVSLADPRNLPVPNCPHGPCLLFTDGTSKWFSCAVFRSSDLCNYKVEVPKSGDFEYKNAKPLKYEYGDGILSQMRDKKAKKTSLYWCRTCCAYVKIPHRDPVEGPLKAHELPKRVAHLLASSKTNQGFAQYWFATNVLRVVCKALENFDTILCIGCPTIFEELLDRQKRAFLLDIDHRFSNFYSDNEFAHYSMLNNHFYQPNGPDKLRNFFAKPKSLAIVVDPPFGAILSALEKSLKQLKDTFFSAKNKSFEIGTILFLPVFMGKHLEGMKLVDYKVTYSNHPQYKHANKTIVRMFTDIDRKRFELPAEEGYRFCDTCERWVSRENEHCGECNSCTTTFGATFHHCDQCARCVKAHYTHCSKCKKCHLPARCIK